MNKVETEFINDLKTLLEKYDVEISADDEYPGYAECGEDIRIRATSYTCSEKIEIDFGGLIRKDVLPGAK